MALTNFFQLTLMKKYNYLIILFLLNFIEFNIFSQDNQQFVSLKNPEVLRNKILEATSSTNSISCSFTQEKHLTMMDEVLISKGNFLFKKPNSVCWQYTYPIDYCIFIFNNQFTIFNDGKISTFDIASNKMFRQVNQLIVTSIQGNFLDDNQFAAGYFENGQFYKVTLKPLDVQVAKMLTLIEIYFDKNDLSVKKVNFIEPGDDFTLIIFSDRKVNITIPDSKFIAGNE